VKKPAHAGIFLHILSKPRQKSKRKAFAALPLPLFKVGHWGNKNPF
jgi:hypothetical protein